MRYRMFFLPVVVLQFQFKNCKSTGLELCTHVGYHDRLINKRVERYACNNYDHETFSNCSNQSTGI